MPAPTSTIGIIDTGLRALIYNRYKDILNLSSENNGVLFYPKQVVNREFAEKRGASKVDFIGLWRTATNFDMARQRTPVARRGMGVSYTNSSMTGSTVAKAVPVDLRYEMSFWTAKLDTARALIEEYLFWLHEDPNLNISVNGYALDLDLHFGDISDDSTINNMYQVGKYFVFNAPIKVDGWLPRFESEKPIQSIILKVYDREIDLDILDYEEIIP